MKRRKGRPNLMLTCDSRPGETFTIPQAAAIAGVTAAAVQGALSGGMCWRASRRNTAGSFWFRDVLRRF